MQTATDDQVKALVNRLIDLKNENNYEFKESEMIWRSHGIELAINMINSRLLKDICRDCNDKHELSESLLKTA